MSMSRTSPLRPIDRLVFQLTKDVPPLLKKGDVVIADRHLQPEPSDFVITKGEHGALTLGRYDPGNKAPIAGTVIELRRTFGRDAQGAAS